MLKTTIFLLLMGFAYQVYSQDDFLTGKLIDAETKETVAFATVVFKDTYRGVISNEDGSFKIPENLKDVGDSLMISSLGYETKIVLLSAFIPEKTKRIELKSVVEVLNEVVVTGESKSSYLSAETLVRRAVRAIPRNYSRTPFSYVGYYRDYQRRNKNYSNLNEAIIKVYDKGFLFNDFDTSKASIYEHRKNENFPRDPLTEKPYDYRTESKTITNAVLQSFGGNEFSILRIHDAIRNYAINSFDFVNRLGADFLNNHKFTKRPDTFDDNRPLYVVAFTTERDGVYVKGKIYISKSKFAIHRLDYSIYLSGRKGKIRQNGHKETTQKLLFDIKLAYKPRDGLMYLNYISVNNIFEIKLPPKFRLLTSELNYDHKRFELVFSTPPKPSDAEKLNRYPFRYQDERLPFDSLYLDGRKVFLFPYVPEGSLNEKIFNADSDSIDQGDFDIRIRRMKDVLGNTFDKSEKITVNQFREFFVQQVQPNDSAPATGNFMNKNQPIFDNKYLSTSEHTEEYWMNTPLQRP